MQETDTDMANCAERGIYEVGISEFPDLLESLEYSLETQLPGTVPKPVPQNQSDKEATNTFPPSIEEGHFLLRSMTLGPIAVSVVGK